MELDEFAEEYRKRVHREGINLGVTRIGVHSGPAIVGNFGGEAFFEYTSYGDTVNTVARLENANKFLGTRICVSSAVADQIPEFKGRQVGTLVLKGKTKELIVFEPLTPDRALAPETKAYNDAFEKLRLGDPGASQAFAAVVGQHGEDSLATFHLKRLLAGEHSVRIVFHEK